MDSGRGYGNTSWHFAQESGLEIPVSHYPLGTSKWYKVEHRLFLLHNKKLGRETTDRHQYHRQFDFVNYYSQRTGGKMCS